MCVRTVLDASAFGHLCSGTKNSAGDQLRKWIDRGDGVVVYSTYEKYGEELSKHRKARELLENFVGNLKAIDVDRTDFEEALSQITGNPLRKSNDEHILALAIAGKATVLFSCDDDLCKDFSNVRVIPKIGKRKRRSVPGLDGEFPNDTTHAGKVRKFLNKRYCNSNSC
ncbi:MAG: PIN domain-containing protein [Rhodothermaceae bacterium]|nr:PIN domain-containing protein [Rhodothermaceae bacterium]MYG68657.1 PIN domain-containing protein [Rhodothermaceae bacterium]MYJ44341.1 PIN domain-containing protein [Rhodothermaceae bacterium]